MKKSPATYFRGVVQEGKKVRWPKRDQLLGSIAVVICIVVFAAIILTVEDSAATVIIEQLKNAFSNLR